jgi:hypothetical protein
MSTTDATARLARLEQRHEFRAELEHRTNTVTAADGIKALDLPPRLSFALQDADLLTIASIQRRVADDSISYVRRIGKGREKVLREALARWGQEHTAERALAELDDDEGGES